MRPDYDMADLVNKDNLEKIALAKKVGQFLTSGNDHAEKEMMRSVAQMLSEDINDTVRAALAFEVRRAAALDPVVAEKIAMDKDGIAETFLAEALCFTDEQLADLVPKLSAAAQITLSKRKDLGMKAVMALVTIAGPTPVTYMIKCEDLSFPEKAFDCVIRRFEKNKSMMDLLSQRADLPLTIMEDLINRISFAALQEMVLRFDLDARLAEKLSVRARYESLCRKILTSTEAQVHSYVLTMREQNKLTHAMVLDLAGRGSMTFFVSSLAVLSGLTRGQVKQALNLKDRQLFVKMMHTIQADSKVAQEFLRMAKQWQEQSEMDEF